jgi:hypothetical protein
MEAIMHRSNTFFFPLALIAGGVLWLMVNYGMLPAANLWALAKIWPLFLIAGGLGILLQSRMAYATFILSLIVVLCAVGAVIYAPQLGWAGPDNFAWNFDFGGAVRGSGTLDSETREVDGFSGLQIDVPAEVTVQQGTRESVTIEAEDNLLAQIATEMRGDTLRIFNSERDWNDRVDPTLPVKITITVVDLNEIAFNGAGKMVVESLSGDTLSLSLDGAGDIALNGLELRSLEVQLDGAGNISASGTAESLSVNMDGIGNFEGADFAVSRAEVDIDGAGSATVRVSDSLDVNIDGAGSVNYYGSPNVKEETDGIGDVKQISE